MAPTQTSTTGGPIQRLPTSVTGFVGAAVAGPVDTPVTVTSAGHYHATFGPSLDADRPLGHALDLFFANGGRSAVVVRAAGPAPEQLVPAHGPGGVHALAGCGVTVLALPGLTASHTEQVRVALERCATDRAVLLLDLPPGPWTPATGAMLARVNAHRERAAAYHPWLLSGGVAVPPSGAVAGVIASTDAERGVWKAPANVALAAVDGLVELVGQAQGEELRQAGVNAIREFPGRGLRVWGARTLVGGEPGEPAARYLNVRRLTDHVVTSLAAGLTFVQDEPSDVALWRRVRVLTEDFLQGLWRQGALPGSTPEQAWFVRCGAGETMTQADVDAGVVVLQWGMATVRPAEFDVHSLRLSSLRAGERADQLALDEEPREGVRDERSRSAVRRERPPVLEVDLGRVVSRYIGETEKNLRRLFDRAEESGEVLLFDEADALFGTRSQVRDAHDRYADQTRRRIEELARERGVPVRWRPRRPDPPG